MTLTAEALWLNSFFSGYDMAILSFAHKMAELAGSVLTPLNKIITLLGEKGILFFLLAVVLMLFPRFRRTGVCMFGAVCCGALITNIILKDQIARPRPFETVDQFRQWWEFVGAPAEDGFSFPSGHVTAAAAGVTSLCLMRGKRWFIPGAIWVLLMMFSRNYLMAHYPSDVLFALLVGVFSGFVAALITQLIFRFLENHSGEGKFYDFLLYSGIEGKPNLKSVAGTVKSGVSSASERRAAGGHADTSARKPAARHQASGSASKAPRHSSSSSGSYQGKH
ncbi:MAG: phosphatase PAP2 family protein [Oscillospiraceae bacterium]|nr:phosphatase PAP2 family protein [Oscillospiraceae bacterium]